MYGIVVSTCIIHDQKKTRVTNYYVFDRIEHICIIKAGDFSFIHVFFILVYNLQYDEFIKSNEHD